jgi:hypothetical protein
LTLLDENITLCEDLLCVCRCMLESKRVVYLDLPKYHYNMHNQCYTLAPFSESKMTALDAFSQIKEMIAGTSRKAVDAFYGLFVGINVSLMALDPGGLNKETTPYCNLILPDSTGPFRRPNFMFR